MTTDDIGAALAAAIAHVRRELGDPTASVAVIAPSRVNANLARRELAFAGPFIRVAFVTPAQLHAELAEPRLRQLGLSPEPPGWLRAIAKRLIGERDDLGPYGAAMRSGASVGSCERRRHRCGGRHRRRRRGSGRREPERP